MLRKYPRMLSTMLKGFELPTNTSHLLKIHNNNEEILERKKYQKYLMKWFVLKKGALFYGNNNNPYLHHTFQ